MKYTYEYPRALNTVDIIIMAANSKILLIKRLNEPFKNMWALPGGFIEMDEKLINSAKRELEEETHLKNIELKQFRTYGDPGRDPRGRNISLVFYGTCYSPSDAKAGDDAYETQWANIKTLPKMAFDHEKIIEDFKNFIG
ncbi:MAG: NUDIX hydrolase [Bacteroidales bacterium]|nr:NUDIX hydrolase [Bacteroidales bacterium]MDD4217735.1 NUDIX hydrolase [Bacteroidales bacterium]MDY0140446.1 NUDIX hydrolase [Bacteroidales bacterium]